MSQQELHGLYGAVKQSELCWPSVMQCGLYGAVNKDGFLCVCLLLLLFFLGGEIFKSVPSGNSVTRIKM